MAELNDFSISQGVIFDSLLQDTPSAPLTNPASNKNMAANLAVLEGAGDIEDSYRNNLANLENGGGILNESDILNQLRNEQFSNANEAFFNFLSDEDIRDGDKANLMASFLQAETDMAQVPNLVGAKSVAEDSELETPEAEMTRVDVGAAINRVIELKKYKQSLLNSEAAKNDTNTLGKIRDFLGLMVPFAYSTGVGRISSEVSDKLDDEGIKSFIDATALPGTAKMKMIEAIRKMPLENQREATRIAMEIVSDNSNITLMDDNDFFKMDMLRSFLEDGYYTSVDEWVDNITGILDVSLFTMPMKALSKFAKVPLSGVRFTPEEYVSKSRKDNVRSGTQPSSTAETYKDTNPAKARALHDAAAGDITGELAEAAYGTTRADAVAGDILPQIGHTKPKGKGVTKPTDGKVDGYTGSVENKVGSIDQAFLDAITPDVNSMDYVNYDGANYYFKNEKIRMRAKAENAFVRDFKNAMGIYARDNMFTIEATPTGSRIRGMYGPKEGGYSDPVEAMEMIKFALRDYGIADKDLSLVKEMGGEWLVVDKATTDAGSYMVGIDYNYKFRPEDNLDFAKPDVKRNFFDFLPPATEGQHGTVNRFVFDPASTFHPRIIKGTNFAVDRAAGLEKIMDKALDSFVKPFSKFKRDRQKLIFDFIKKANAEGIEHNQVTMRAEGLTAAEMDVMRKWKTIQDTSWELENLDKAMTLRNKGFKTFIDKATGTVDFAKPIPTRAGVKGPVKIYNHKTGRIEPLPKEAVDRLYEEGGVLARLMEPEMQGDEIAELIISEEKLGGGYLRAINEGDRVLNYRKGYYQVHYKNPIFIEEIIKDSMGREVHRRAVSSAGSIADAKLEASRLGKTADPDANVEYIIRSDIKKEKFADMRLQEASSRGRTAQRRRGKRLHEATHTANELSSEHMLDPLEAITKSIRSVSRRTAIRPVTDVMKDRFTKQYKRVLTVNKYGEVEYPVSRKEIGRAGQKTATWFNREVADARSTYEYIQFLEDGYINGIDASYKAAMNLFADHIGEINAARPSKGLALGERGLRALGAVAPTQEAKALAFNLYIAMNPLRHVVIQSNQAVRLHAIDPKYTMSGKLNRDLGVLGFKALGGVWSEAFAKKAGYTVKEIDALYDQWIKSGLWAAVDANNLTRNSLKSVADITSGWGQARKLLGMPLEVSQKVGFDVGETTNMMTAWLTFRDKAIRAGKTLDAETMADVSAEARNFTYNMNHAGDSPYNQNFLNTMFQFLQVPHKALMQVLTNRLLSRGERAKLAAFDIVMWGIPPAAGLSAVLDVVPDDQIELKDALSSGLQDFGYNKIASLLIGEDANIDFGDLAPYDIYGMAEIVESMWSTDLVEIIASSPSGQLFFGGNPRVTNVFRDAARYFSLVDDDSQDVETWQEMARSFGKLSSGMSNAFKVIYAQEYDQKVNSHGNIITDDGLNSAQTLAQLFGFKTKTEAKNMTVIKEMYQHSEDMRNDIKGWFKDKNRRLSNKGLSADEIRAINIRDGEAFRVWRQFPEARKIIAKEIAKSRSTGNMTMFTALSKTMGMMKIDDYKDLVNKSGLEQKSKDTLIEVADRIEKYRNPEDE